MEQVGEWWNILIMRDAMCGMTRFDEFQKSLSIPSNTLSKRLLALSEAGLLERRRYSERPPRDEYILTKSGRAFLPVIAAMQAWSNEYFSPDGIDTLFVQSGTKTIVSPIVVDKKTGNPITLDNTEFCAGPAAKKEKRDHFAALNLPVMPASKPAGSRTTKTQ